MSNSKKFRVNYGVDAPGVVATLSIGGLACVLIGFLFRIFGGPQDSVLVISVFVSSVLAGGGMLFVAAVMLWSSKYGKLLASRHLIRHLEIKDHENILDVGCGRGLLLIEAAKRLKSGKAIGVDRWQSRDLSGNKAEVALANARAENVAERVEIRTGDMRSLPIENEYVEIVVSSLAIHNIPTREGRIQAIEEIARVLKPEGRVALLDLHCTQEYAETLRRLGWSHVERSGRIFLFLHPVRIVYGTKSKGECKDHNKINTVNR